MDSIAYQEAMIPARQAADIAGISPQLIWYWEKTKLIEPAVAERLSQRNHVRLYSLDRLLELVAGVSLVEKPGISLQHVRRLLEYRRESGGTKRLYENFASLSTGTRSTSNTLTGSPPAGEACWRSVHVLLRDSEHRADREAPSGTRV